MLEVYSHSLWEDTLKACERRRCEFWIGSKHSDHSHVNYVCKEFLPQVSS